MNNGRHTVFTPRGDLYTPAINAQYVALGGEPVTYNQRLAIETLHELAQYAELGFNTVTALYDSCQGHGTAGWEAYYADPGLGHETNITWDTATGLANLQFAQVHAKIRAKGAAEVNFSTNLPEDDEDEDFTTAPAGGPAGAI
jgi:hypothetical protein